MLRIYIGELEDDRYIHAPAIWFDNTYSDSWITEPLSAEMIRDVDKSEVVGPNLIQSPFLGPVSPMLLSGGVKTLLLMGHDQEHIFNASACGDNCARWLLKIAEDKDVTVRLGYLMDFGPGPFTIQILNDGAIVTEMRSFLRHAAPYIGSSAARPGSGIGGLMRGESGIRRRTAAGQRAERNGGHRVIVQNRRVRYEFVIRGKITVLRGDSGTGKTVLVDLIRQADRYGKSSGVEVSCDKAITVLGGRRWKRDLDALSDSIIFVDGNESFLGSPEFAQAIRETDNDYVLVSRDPLVYLPGSEAEVDGIRMAGQCGRGEKTCNEFYPLHARDKRFGSG